MKGAKVRARGGAETPPHSPRLYGDKDPEEMRYKRERDATYVTSQLIGKRAKTPKPVTGEIAVSLHPARAGVTTRNATRP